MVHDLSIAKSSIAGAVDEWVSSVCRYEKSAVVCLIYSFTNALAAGNHSLFVSEGLVANKVVDLWPRLHLVRVEVVALVRNLCQTAQFASVWARR